MIPLKATSSPLEFLKQKKIPLPNELPKNIGEKQLKEVCSQFESIFINQMLSEMRESINQSELLPKSQGEKLFQGMLDEEYAKEMAVKGDLGLGNQIFLQMKKYLKNN